MQIEAAQYAGTHFAMEFSGYDSANMEKANGWSNGGMFNCTWTENNVSFSNDGIMSLKIDSNGNGGYTGGEYRTRQTFGYGMYQVNMKPIKNPGVVTSFFTYTGPTDGTIWDEIDIEFLGYDTTKVQFNYFTNSVGGHEYLYDLGFDASKEFHTYGFYWGPGTITWYVDGKAVYTVNSSDVPVTPGKIMMNVWPGTGVDDWLQPYNGVTPLTGYYDWAAYDAPGAGSGEQTTTKPPVTTTKAPTQETEQPVEVFGESVSATGEGLITAVWGNPLNGQKFNVYLDGRIAYDVNGAKLENVDCASYIIPASEGNHTVKITGKLGEIETRGVSVNVTVSGTAVTSSAQQETTALPSGYTTAGPNWTDLNYWSVYFANGWANDPTGSYRNGNSYNDFGIYINRASATDWGIQLKTQPISVQAGAKYVAKVTANANMASTSNIRFKEEITQKEVLCAIKSGENTFTVEFTAEEFAQIFFDLGQTPAGLKFEITSFRLQKVEEDTEVLTEEATEVKTTEEATEAPTEAPTEEETTVVHTINGGIEINGYQVSAEAKGMRTLYSVDSTINGKAVVSSGIVYSLSQYATEEELYVGSPSDYVRSFQSTDAGKTNVSCSESDIATSYAMTMKFATKEVTEYNTGWRICAYAELSDGTYVYTDAYTYTIYNIADKLYQDCSMTTKERHDYLYTEILSLVNKDYQLKEYDWSNSVVEA